jgi:pimeloyl-ACP methyl ester carboxylesterase
MKILFWIVGSIASLLLVVGIGGWLLLRGPDIPFEVLKTRHAGTDDHFIDLPGSVRAHYREQGRADAPVVVLLHGYGDSYATWERWSEQLKGEFRVISLDLPGHGLTQAPDDYQPDSVAYARLVDAFAERLKLPAFALVGNSMGGAVAWQTAVRYPGRMNALVLLAAAGKPGPDMESSPSLAFRILQYPLGRKLLEHIDNRPLILQGLKAEVFDRNVISDAFVDRWAEYQRLPGHRKILMSMRPGAHLLASPEALAGIRIPTLVIHGAADPLIPVESSRRFAAEIPGARLIVYPDSGHLPQWEVAQKSARDVAEFLNTRTGEPAHAFLRNRVEHDFN